VLAAFVLGGIATGSFILVEARTPNPMLPLTLFRSGDFSGANLLTLLLYAALAGGLFFFPLNLIQVQKYSATSAGAALLPFILIMFLLSRWSGGLVKRYGAKLPLVVGPAVAAVGFALFIRPGMGGGYFATFFPAVVVLGLGMAISVAPLTTTVMNAVGESQAGIASGVNNAVSRTAGLIAVAALGLVMLRAFDDHFDQRLLDLGVSPPVQRALQEQRAKLAGAIVPADLDPGLRTALRQAIDESFVFGFRKVMMIAVALALLASLVAWRWIGGKMDEKHSLGRPTRT
jgi:hypothetical protein